MEKDDISKIEEQVKELSGEGLEESTPGETKIVDDIQELEIVEEDTFEEKVEEEPVEGVPEIVSEETIEEEKEVVPEEIKEEPLPVEENKEKPKKKKSSKVLIISLIVGILILLCILGTAIFLKTKKTDTSSKELTQGQKKQIIEEYGDALEGIISVYLEKQNLLLEYDDAILLVKYDHDVVCDEHEIYEDGQVFLDKCSIDDVGVTYSYGKKQEKPELKEGAIKVYVSKKTKEATLTEPSDVSQYDLYSFDIDGRYSNLNLISKKSSWVYYYDEHYISHVMNYITREKAIPNLTYVSVSPIAYGDECDPKYVAVQVESSKWGVYNLETGDNVVPANYTYFPVFDSSATSLNSRVVALDDGLLVVINYSTNNQSTRYGLINYRQNKTILPVSYITMKKCGDYLWAVDEYGFGHIFDHKGVEKFDSSKFDELYGAVDGKFVLVKDGKDVKLVTMEGRLIYNYGELTLGSSIYSLTYKNGALFQFNNPDADNEDLDHKCIEISYDSSTRSGEVKSTYCGGIAKPILYLYPEKTTKVTVQFEHPEFLETTYPKYIEKWEVTAKKNGDLTDKDGKYYYGLYWDEAKTHSTDFSTGYYVTKEKAIDFLEQKLTYIGLTDRERNEFIMYWLPVLERNEKSLVYFELTEERESYNKIFISPKPDSLLRLVIHIKKVDQEVEIPKQKLTKFQRKGFVAVEWGGVTY